MPVLAHSSGHHWFIAHREDATKVLLLDQEVHSRTERYLESGHSRAHHVCESGLALPSLSFSQGLASDTLLGATHMSPSLAARWRNDTIHADEFDQLTVMVGNVP